MKAEAFCMISWVDSGFIAGSVSILKYGLGWVSVFGEEIRFVSCETGTGTIVCLKSECSAKPGLGTFLK